MAWYAELKRRKWYRINGMNMPYIYKKHLYDEWYNSLTEEQKQCVEENKKKRQEREERELLQSLINLATLGLFYKCRIPDKYHGVYDENGFSKIK